MKKKIFTLIILSLIAMQWISAQKYTIRGTVADVDGNPIPGVIIIIKGTTQGTITDINGKFVIAVSDDLSTLVFSFIGYITEEKIVTHETPELRIIMAQDIVSLEEVVTVGYAVTKKKDVTGSISPGKPIKALSAVKYAVPEVVGSEPSEMYIMEERSYDSELTEDSRKPGAGLLTAGEINDFGKWELWNDITEGELNQYVNTWGINTDNRYSVQVKSEDGFPITGAKIKLVYGDTTIWQAMTDNTGKAELWANSFKSDKVKESRLEIVAEYKNQSFTNKNVHSFHNGVNMITIPAECSSPGTIDIAFVVDATGSMSDEINYLKAELDNIMGRLKDTLPGNTINLGCLFYRDNGDSYLTKKSDLTARHSDVIDFIRENSADGGGDTPEAVEAALDTVVNHFSWSDSAMVKVVFLILDAPPHDDPSVKNNLKRVIQTAALKGIRIVPVTCSGIDKSTEFLMRAIALLTNGTYVFLTDDSGIGDSHIKPTTDEYTVELLNDLLIRLIIQYTSSTNCSVTADLPQADTLVIKSKEYVPEIDSTEITDTTNSVNDPIEVQDKKSFEWKCFPNPTTGIIHIVSEEELSDFYVCDVSGKIILRHSVSGETETTLDLTPYPMGVYFIRYEYKPDSWMTGRIVLIR